MIDETVTKNPRSRFLGKKEVQTAICQTITMAQKEIRDIENDSSASLRDVGRFIVLFQFFEKWETLSEYHAIVMTVTIAYLLRIGCEKRKTAVMESIQRVLAPIQKGDEKIISEIFEDISSKVAKEALQLFGDSGDDISVNKPLRENLIVILTSIALSIHVLICGKPGTSKTLAIEIAQKILAMNF